MENSSSALGEFALELTWRQCVFLCPFPVLFTLAHLYFPDSGLMAVALLGCGALAVLADLWSFALVPGAFRSPESLQVARVAAIAAGVLVGFLAGTSIATPDEAFTHLLLCLGLKLAVPVAFGLWAHGTFRDEVYPLVLKLGQGTPALSQALGEQAAARAVEHRRMQHRQACVRDARRRVLAFYNRHRARLQGRFDASWLEVEVPARIPDDATDQQAYRAASDLLAQMTGFLREHQEQLDAVDAQLRALDAARRAFRDNATLDPEVLRDELAELDRRQRELEAQRGKLPRAA